MLQGQGSLQAPRGDSTAQAEGDAVPCGAASSGRNLLAQPPLLFGFGIPAQGRGGRSWKVNGHLGLQEPQEWGRTQGMPQAGNGP